MRALFATAELAPVATAGELGDAAAGLVSALRTEGVDVEVALPDYRRDLSPLEGEERRPLDVPSWAAPAVVRSGEHPVAGRLHLISAPRIARSHPYLRPDGAPWPDNAARFLAFSQAVAALVRRLQPDVVHLNGWHAGATLAALTDPPPAVVSLGDIAHQGVTDGSWLSRLGARGQHYEWWGRTNPLSGAIALADAVVAASPTHAGEIQTPARGYGLDEPLRHRWAALSGIRAGIDTASWNPETDAHLVATYRSSDGGGIEAAKAANRRALLTRCGWPDDETPLAVMLSPLTTRKGADLIAPIAPVLGHVPLRLLVHAAGDQRIARTLAALAADHRAHFALVEGHEDSLRHLALGGADLLIVPSRDEPCGTDQLAAMRYGTIPVVTAVGGLRDTVPDADWTDEGNGFVADRVDSIALVSALFRAARLLADRRRRRAQVRRVMELDWSWRCPATEHAEVYARVAGRRGRHN